MSIRIMSQVWDRSKQTGSALLVLLAIADFANDQGLAWPSYDTLAKKSRVSVRSVMRLVNKMVEDGELEIDRSAGPHGTNLYRVVIGSYVQETAPPDVGGEEAAPDTETEGGDNVAYATVSYVGDDTQTIIKDSVVVKTDLTTDSVNDGSGDKPTPQMSPRGDPGAELLVSEGVNRELAETLAGKHDLTSVQHAVDVYRFMREAGKARSPGYLVRFLSERWADPQEYAPPERRCPECGLPWHKDSPDCSTHRAFEYAWVDDRQERIRIAREHFEQLETALTG